MATKCTDQILDQYSARKYETCECGASLKNIAADLPHPFKLVGVCDLAWITKEHGNIDVTKSKISFDQYTDGWIPYGHLLISGKISLQGVLTVEPGPAGTYWFEPRPPLIRRETPLASQMKMITFSNDTPFKVLNPPKQLAEKDCYTVDISIDVEDFHVYIADGDENGSFPLKFSLGRARNYRECDR